MRVSAAQHPPDTTNCHSLTTLGVVIPPLTDLIEIGGGAGLVVGAIIGLAMRARTEADLVANLVSASTLGAIGGTVIAFSVWFGGQLAGG